MVGGEAVKASADVISGAIAVATLASWLPPIAAVFTIAWTAIQIFSWIEARVTRPRQ
ncbi:MULTISPECIES: hypothetical protein [Sphingomonas]|uniref:hypothetical protein n=1 Tax=Sphingomonas TaxID=13687 RepID=UPI0013E0986A|nr:hypothetical protein [Sphingomonas sp. ABOLF]